MIQQYLEFTKMNHKNTLQEFFQNKGSVSGRRTIWVHIFVFAVLMSASSLLFAAYGAVAALPKLQLNKGGSVNAIVELADGSLIIGGRFAYVNGKELQALARLKADGTLDEDWNPLFEELHSHVNTLLLAGDSLYVGGSFSSVAGTPRRGIVRLDVASAQVDSNWHPDGFLVEINSMAMSGNGEHIFVGGRFNKLGGKAINAVAKLSTLSAEADADWNPQLNNSSRVDAMLLSGSDLFVGGRISEISGVSRKGIAKLSAIGTGALDMDWNPSTNGDIRSFVLSETDNQLYVGGRFSTIGGVSRNGIARLNTSGGAIVDATWNPTATLHGFLGDVRVLALAGSTLYAGGLFSEIGGQPRNSVARLSTADGTADHWNPDAGESAFSGQRREVHALLLASDGSRVHLGGTFNKVDAADALSFATVEKNTGDLIAGFEDLDIGSPGEINALVKSGNDLYFGGYFFRVNGEPLQHLGKLDTTTGQVVNWDAGFGGQVFALAVDGASVYAGGRFTDVGGLERNHIAKLSGADAAVDAAWNPDFSGDIHALLLQGNALYVGGKFSKVNNTYRQRLAKITADTGTLDPAWDPAVNNDVYVLTHSGADLFVGGRFSEIGSLSRNRLAKIDAASGVVDSSWSVDANREVYALAVQGDALFVGGSFTEISGLGRNRIAKLSVTTGAVDSSWNPDANAKVSTLALSEDGADLYMGGQFSGVAGTTSLRMAVAKVTAGTGLLDPEWNPSAEQIRDVQALAVAGTGLYAGGKFSRIGGKSTGLGHIVDGHLLSVTATATDTLGRTGLITSTPEGIRCTPQSGSLGCEQALVAGDFILTATSTDPEITIGQEWFSGCESAGGGSDTCGLTLNGDKLVGVGLFCEVYDFLTHNAPVANMSKTCNNIKVNNGFEVGNDIGVIFNASNSVELGPGFRVSDAPRYFRVRMQ